MKRPVIGIAAVAAMTLILAACSGTTTTGAAGGKPSLLLWVDTPRVPQAKLYQKLMANKETIKIEVMFYLSVPLLVAAYRRFPKAALTLVIYGIEISLPILSH